MKAYNKKSVILFDGVCNLCNSSVQFVLKHDSKKHFLFASIQSDAAINILLQLKYEISNLDSIILVEDDEIYDKSTAALRIARNLNPIWNFLYILIVIPKSIRDYFYDIIAKNRYKWFGKQNTCPIYNGTNKNRFI